MRMKLFTAPSRDEVIALIHSQMGPDAILLGEREVEEGYEVRAAVERPVAPLVPQFAINPNRAPVPAMHTTRHRERVKDVLTWHGAPEGFADVVANAAAKLVTAHSDPTVSFSAGLEGVIGFAPVAPALPKPLMLVGPPGAGKTSTVAKLIRRAHAANATAMPIVADFDATNGAAQLGAYLRTPENSIPTFETPDQLIPSLEGAISRNMGVVVDTPPINPNDKEDLERLKDLMTLIDAEPILVISAEGHPLDLEDHARAFSGLGIRRAIVTKLDVVRRRGGVLAALGSARINLSHMALTPFIGGGLIPATPNRLARILLEDAPAAETLKGAA